MVVPGARKGERAALAAAADGLTLARAVIAVALVPMLGTKRVASAATLLGLAWLSDFFDGRAARASGRPTLLGRLDLTVDTAVGAAIVLGFAAYGWVPPVVGVGLVAVLVTGFALSRNEALSMILQAIGYGLLLWRTWRDGHTTSLMWLLVIIGTVALVNRRILWERSLPTFFGGVASLFRRRG